MSSKPFLWAVCIIFMLSLISVAVVSAQGNLAELVVINFVGNEITFTLDGTPYTVPGTDTVPDGGRLTLSLAPGRHEYSAQVPGGEGTNGELDLASGQRQVLGARLERSEPVLSPADVVLEEPRDVLVLFEASLTPPAPAAVPQPTPLQPLPADQGALVLVNHIGEDIVVDISGMLYRVPANGRLQIDLPPGEVSYSASAGLSGMNGTALVKTGTYTGLGFTREIPPEEPDYELGKPVPTPVPLKMSVFPVSLEEEPIGVEPSLSPEVASPTPDDISPFVPAGQGAVSVMNYIGETLTFTINNQAYTVAGSGGELKLDLAPGEYTYTASTPGAGMNGSLLITGGTSTRVSVTLDVPSGEMRIYIDCEI